MRRENKLIEINKAQLKKIIIIVSINVLCLIAFFVCLILSNSISVPLRSQQAARAWAGQSGERFAQLSAFFPESSGFNEESVFQLRREIDRALLSASLESAPGRTLYTDAWSAEAGVSVTSERERNPVAVTAVAVGGDFFMFHPLFLRDGNYLTPDDLMKDRVIIDEVLAWRLFGAIRVAGFEISINNKIFQIAGVISRESDFASSEAFTDEFGLFITFDALSAMTEGGAEIRTYEIVMPDPITGFAKRAFTENIGSQRVYIVENSERFSLGNSFARIGSFGRNSMRTDAISLPYWENAARIAEDWLALLLLLSLMFIAFPIICAVIYSVVLIRFGIGQAKGAIIKVIDERNRRDYEKYLSEHGSEPQIYDSDEVVYDVYSDDDIINYEDYGDESIIRLNGHESDNDVIIDDHSDGGTVRDGVTVRNGENGENSVNYNNYNGENVIIYDVYGDEDSDNYEKEDNISPFAKGSDEPDMDDITKDEVMDSIKNDVNDILIFGSSYDPED